MKIKLTEKQKEALRKKMKEFALRKLDEFKAKSDAQEARRNTLDQELKNG